MRSKSRPKVPKRGSLAARGMNGQIPQSDWYSLQPGGGACLRGRGRQIARDCSNLPIFQIGPTSAKCTVWIRHGHNIGSTWGQLRPTRPQLPPSPDPLGPNFGPAWLQHAAAWPQGPLRPKLKPTWLQHGGHGRLSPKSPKHLLSLISPTYFGHR